MEPTEAPPAKARRGFAAMDPEKQREIARKGGRASGGRPENLRGVDRREAGRKGGKAVVDRYGPQHMAEIGRKGGRSSGGFARMDPERQREIAAKGGRAGGGHAENLLGVDRHEAGRKGGEAVVERYGATHMSEIGRLGGSAHGHKAGEPGEPSHAQAADEADDPVPQGSA